MANTLSYEQDLAEAHRQLVKGADIQWALPDPPPPQLEPPPVDTSNWFTDLFGGLAGLISHLFWPLVIVIGAFVLFFIFRDAMGIEWRFPWERTKDAGEAAEPEWAPDEKTAKVLLSDADVLAAQGDYAGAAHLLLKRSVDDFSARRPQFMQPSLTARDISVSPALPDTARSAFGHIARVVEASFFGGGAVTKAAWDECRNSYEQFALKRSWA